VTPLKPQHSRSGECHSSHRHKNALAHQKGFRCWGSGGGNRAMLGVLISSAIELGLELEVSLRAIA